MHTLIRVVIVGLIAWLIWQVSPIWSGIFLVTYITAFLIYHAYRFWKYVNWECPEPYDYETWRTEQNWNNRRYHYDEESYHWYCVYRETFPADAKEWNKYRDNPYE